MAEEYERSSEGGGCRLIKKSMTEAHRPIGSSIDPIRRLSEAWLTIQTNQYWMWCTWLPVGTDYRNKCDCAMRCRISACTWFVSIYTQFSATMLLVATNRSCLKSGSGRCVNIRWSQTPDRIWACCTCGLRPARKEKARANEHGCCGWICTHTRSRGLCNSYCLLRACAVRWEIPWSQSRHSKRAKLQQLNMSKCHPALAFLRVPFFFLRDGPEMSWEPKYERLFPCLWLLLLKKVTHNPKQEVCVGISPLRDKNTKGSIQKITRAHLKIYASVCTSLFVGK